MEKNLNEAKTGASGKLSEMTKKNPILSKLIDTFDLIPV